MGFNTRIHQVNLLLMKGFKMQTYEELKKIGQKYYNDNNFCTVIAVATVCKMSFGRARIKMQEAGRKHQNGAYAHQYHQVIKNRGFRLEEVAGFRGCHVKTMGQKLGKGTYLVQVNRHVLAIVDGVINDWSAERSLRVKTVYQVIKNEGI